MKNLFHKTPNRKSRQTSFGTLRLLPFSIAALFIVVSIFVSCEEEKKEIISGSTDPETTPTISTRDVTTLISDSGITRYHITTPLWNVFDEAEEPSWKFPEGLHIQTFDLKMKPEATVDCDTATFLTNKQIWHLKGYVNIRNTIGEKFLTEELFWDQRARKVYSDSFIHIERDQKVIEGYGFESNETMTRYHVKRVSGIFPASQFKTDTTRRATPIVAPTPEPEKPEPTPKPTSKRSGRKIVLSDPDDQVQSVDNFDKRAIKLAPNDPPKRTLPPNRR